VEAPRVRETVQLRPLGVGDIVDRVFALYRARPLLFLAASAVPYLLFLLVVAVATFSLFTTEYAARIASLANDAATGATQDPGRLADTLVGLLWFALFVVIAALVLLSPQTAALVYATSQRYLGKDVTLGDAFRAGLRATPRVILAGLTVFGLFIILWLALALVMILTRQTSVVVIGMLVGLAGSVYLFASTLVTPVVATVEDLGPISAIRRSWSLSKGNRWRVIGLQLLLLVINVVIGGIVSAIFLTTLIADATLRTVAQQVVNAATTIAWAPVQWATFTILYYDLRVRREAFDLQLAAEALPRAP
jgi:uncharacterized membrane protein